MKIAPIAALLVLADRRAVLTLRAFRQRFDPNAEIAEHVISLRCPDWCPSMMRAIHFATSLDSIEICGTSE